MTWLHERTPTDRKKNKWRNMAVPTNHGLLKSNC